MLLNKKIKFSLMLFSVFVLSGCQQPAVSNSLKALNDSLGKALSSNIENQASSTFNFFAKKNAATSTVLSSADLSVAQKNSIDDWLAKKGLNRYGDAPNAVYTGGTPLFNEKTGKAVERYDYILNKFPDILNIIKQGK
jgi:hypothetical protein